jgi:DNA-binding NarL/FixJ family response regulator
MGGAPIVLVVSAEPQRAAGLAQQLGGFEVLAAADASGALELLRARTVDVVLADYRLGTATGLELFAQCAALFLDVRKVLASDYEDLPEIVAARANGLLSRVVPMNASPENLIEVLREVLAGARETTASAARSVFTAADVAPLLKWTASRAARVRNVIVREPPAGADALQLQFVMPARTGLEAFRQDLVTRWHLPLKQRDAEVPRAQKDHPLVTWLGALSAEAEIYSQRVEKNDTWAYVALLPWRKEQKVTCVLGVHDGVPGAAWRGALLEAHAAALAQVATFPIPQVPADEEASGFGQVVPEYDWVVTRGYAGRDRRQEPTAFLGRHAFLGQRARIPSRIAGRLGAFADRLSPALRKLFGVYVALALIDAVLTWKVAGAGKVAELNPIIGALLSAGPAWFFLGKNAVALGAFAIVTRFEHARAGLWLVRALVLLFALVDAWWLVLLLR